MKNGFIKVGAAAVEISISDIKSNTAKIIEKICEADNQELNILVLPELCVSGYTCADLLFSSLLIKESENALLDIAKATENKYPVVIVGLPISYKGKLYNCAAVLYDGKILGIVPKTYIPNHGEFYEKRYFESALSLPKNAVYKVKDTEIPFGANIIFEHETLKEYSIGVEICEDLWTIEPPSAKLCRAGAVIIANPSASDALVGKTEYRRMLVNSAAARMMCGYIFSGADSSESTQDIVMAGHSIISENGIVLAENLPFQNQGLLVTELDIEMLNGERSKNTSFTLFDNGEFRFVSFSQKLNETKLTRYITKTPFIPENVDLLAQRAEEILNIQAQGLARRLTHTNAKSAVIGISGGLDSTLAVLVAVRAMKLCGRPSTDILAVTMPCFGTTNRTKSNAVTLCELLGVTLKTVDISDSVRTHFNDIDKDPLILDVTYENAQARERTQVLMDMANMYGGLVIGTGDLSELALGWATYNGDHMSMYGVNASLPKTLIRHIVAYEALRYSGELEKVLTDILDTPVSPELLPVSKNGDMTQKTEDLVGPYELHDFFLYRFLRYGEAPNKIYRLASIAFKDVYTNETILHWLQVFARRFFAQQFKRSCLPDGAKVGTISLSPRSDWRMPSDATSKMWLEEIEKLK